MTAISVTLDEAQRAWLTEQVAQGGYPDANAFIRKIIEEERLRRSSDWLDELVAGAGDPLAARRQVVERLTRLLDEAQASGPATVMTKDDWREIRRQIQQLRTARET